MSDQSDNSVKLFSYTDDMPKNGKGMLIPRKKSHAFTPKSVQGSSSTKKIARALARSGGVALAAVAFCAWAILCATVARLTGRMGFRLRRRHRQTDSPRLFRNRNRMGFRRRLRLRQ